jgi:predicted ATPase
VKAPGLFPAKEKMPVNDELFSLLMERYQKHDQFQDAEFARKCIMDNRHNAITATYYLERKKQEKLASGIKDQNRTKWFSRLK